MDSNLSINFQFATAIKSFAQMKLMDKNYDSMNLIKNSFAGKSLQDRIECKTDKKG